MLKRMVELCVFVGLISLSAQGAATDFKVVEPLKPGDLVYRHSGEVFCYYIALFTDDPCHVGVYVGNGKVIEATCVDPPLCLNPHAVHEVDLITFEREGFYPFGFRGSKTYGAGDRFPSGPSDSDRTNIVSYVKSKLNHSTFYSLFTAVPTLSRQPSDTC